MLGSAWLLALTHWAAGWTGALLQLTLCVTVVFVVVHLTSRLGKGTFLILLLELLLLRVKGAVLTSALQMQIFVKT